MSSQHLFEAFQPLSQIGTWIRFLVIRSRLSRSFLPAFVQLVDKSVKDNLQFLAWVSLDLLLTHPTSDNHVMFSQHLLDVQGVDQHGGSVRANSFT